MEPQNDVSILVAEELCLIREGIAALCERRVGFRVVAQSGDGAVALRQIEALVPDVAVLDLMLPVLHPLEVVRQVRESNLPTRVVLISTRVDRKTVLEALRLGASGFVLKSGPASHLIEAIHQVVKGGVYVSPALEIDKIFNGKGDDGESDPIARLSAREYQVFCLLVDGVRAKEIAARLELSPKTVDTYRASLMRKLDIHDIAGLVKFAIQRKLIKM